MGRVGYKRTIFLSSEKDKTGIKNPLIKSLVPYMEKISKHFSIFSGWGNSLMQKCRCSVFFSLKLLKKGSLLEQAGASLSL